MKKIFTLLLSLCTLSTVFAQYGNSPYPQQRDQRNVVYQDRNYDQSPNNGNSSAQYGRYDQQQSRGGYSDRQRQVEMDRSNHAYDTRIGDYRNDRSLNDYDRNRRIEEAERERNNRLKTVGGAVLLGGILGVLIGSHL